MGKDDGLPELLCIKCLESLEIAYRFRKQAEASYRFLRSYKQFQQVTGKREKIIIFEEDFVEPPPPDGNFSRTTVFQLILCKKYFLSQEPMTAMMNWTKMCKVSWKRPTMK